MVPIVWDPYTADNACQVERVQRRFLRFASYFLGINCAPHNITSVANQLLVRKRNMGISFLKGLLAGHVDVDLTLINTRSITSFHVPLCTTN